MIRHTNDVKQTIYYQMNTQNESFIEMYQYLRDTGIQNNRFFLAIIDSDLIGINPRDPNLSIVYKQKILIECMHNYWYFLREVIRIPDQGGSAGGGIPYKLHRGNLALNFCMVNNYNVFAEFPRQHGKTISVVCRLLWEFMFGTTNSEMMMINKKHDDSKDNLQRLKNIREALPDYLKMAEVYGPDGKKLKQKDTVETLENAQNRNKIRTLPAARNKVLANSLGRGCTQPRQWYDEYAFIPYNSIVYLSATPAFKKASMVAKSNNAPYGIVITTTPGDLTTAEGVDACETKDAATQFTEKWYDMSKGQLDNIISKNENSAFVYIRFTYQQLGSSEAWFREMVIDMKKNWSAIRREVLLEWSSASDNSPFKKEDLNIVKGLVKHPKSQIMLCGTYPMDIFMEMDLRYPPIIGVDVSGGFKRDSSAITIIDSVSTNVIATLNCNYISTIDLASVIYELVTKYMSNAVVNIERNGGFGASVLAKLLKTKVKQNIYYEIKDKVIEERYDGINTVRKTQKTKVFGLDSTGKIRELLMEILRQRMENHKDKFISPIIYKELETLEVKRSGKIEHSSTGHDDQIFSYLMALYVWYEGRDVMERWGIDKKTLKTDADLEEAIVTLEDKYDGIIDDIAMATSTNDMVQRQLDAIADPTMTYEQWCAKQAQEDKDAMSSLLKTRLGKMAYESTYGQTGMDYYLDNDRTTGLINTALLEDFYEGDIDINS